MGIIAKEYKELDPKEKSKYIDMANKSREKYEAQKKKYQEEMARTGYIDNVPYPAKLLKRFVQDNELPYDISQCADLLGKILGYWVIDVI